MQQRKGEKRKKKRTGAKLGLTRSFYITRAVSHYTGIHIYLESMIYYSAVQWSGIPILLPIIQKNNRRFRLRIYSLQVEEPPPLLDHHPLLCICYSLRFLKGRMRLLSVTALRLAISAFELVSAAANQSYYGRYPCQPNLSDHLDTTPCALTGPPGSLCVPTIPSFYGGHYCGTQGAACVQDYNCDNGSCYVAGGQTVGSCT